MSRVDSASFISVNVSMRKLIAGIGVAGFVVLGSAGAVSAQTTDTAKFANKASEECAKLLTEGKTPDDCQKAPSPILPATNELIWGGISFVVLLVLMGKFAFPMLKTSMEDRTERIRKDLDEAETAKTEATGIREEYARQLADAKTESARIIEEARQAADTVRRDLTQRAEAEAAELRHRNAEQLDAERARIMSELHGQVASLAIELAEKVVEANLDRDTNNRLIESYITSVGSR
ncbi:MAG: F-type H+-transporting ATPase subunit b [Actinomycetota bacterium]|jgi:F-type H+-transporting ATPase subunit b|nr:F-type H+-transporting ATPase subunit b [Actinomycetota bacterium]